MLLRRWLIVTLGLLLVGFKRRKVLLASRYARTSIESRKEKQKLAAALESSLTFRQPQSKTYTEWFHLHCERLVICILFLKNVVERKPESVL